MQLRVELWSSERGPGPAAQLSPGDLAETHIPLKRKLWGWGRQAATMSRAAACGGASAADALGRCRGTAGYLCILRVTAAVTVVPVLSSARDSVGSSCRPGQVSWLFFWKKCFSARERGSERFKQHAAGQTSE